MGPVPLSNGFKLIHGVNAPGSFIFISSNEPFISLVLTKKLNDVDEKASDKKILYFFVDRSCCNPET